MRIRRKKYRKLLRFLIIIVIVLIAMSGGTKALTDRGHVKIPEPSPTPFIQPAQTISLNSTVDLYSPNAVVMDLESGELLLDKDGSDRIYPASLTKIMTAIVAIENIPDLGQKLLLPDQIFGELYAADASMAGFLPGEEASALDLLYGALLPSGAECCIGLADYIAGSEDAYVTLMNQKAYEIGMKNTNFINTTGLHEVDHYTTAKDLAILLRYALQNDTFRRIFTSESYTTSATNKHPEGITFRSTLFKNLSEHGFPGGTLLGGKTGYTGKAGLCLASLAKIGDKEYIMVSTGAQGDHTTEQYNITDALTVYHSISGNPSLSMVSDD